MGRATGEISHDDGRHPLWGRPDHGDFAVVRLWVPNWSSTSCDLGIFVDQPAESVAASEAKVGL
jgi:hypothetical protein